MKDNDLLDEKDDNTLLLGIVQWWEQRRLRYNFIVGLVGIVATFFASTIVNLLWQRESVPTAIFVYALVVNIAYSLSWVLEILLRYYFNITLSERSRNVLYWGGVLISFLPILAVLMGVYHQQSERPLEQDII